MRRGSTGGKSLIELPPEFIGRQPADRERAGPGDEAWFLGVDGGATKTLALVSDLSGAKIGIGRGGPSNRDSIGSKTAINSLTDAVKTALDDAGLTGRHIASAVLAIAGIHGDSDRQWVRSHLAALRACGRVYVQNDVVAAWAAGTSCRPGVAVISGTGSNAFGVNSRGQGWRAGGWGHILGDEGSGYWIGIQGIRAVLSSYDGRGPKTSLLGRLPDFYGLASVEEMVPLAYGKGLTKDEIAAFAVCVFEEARSGDRVSADLFRKAGRALGTAARAVIRAIGMQKERFPLALTGSVFDAGELVTRTFSRVVKQTAPSAELVIPDMPPVVGAVHLAAKAAGYGHVFAPDGVNERLASLLRRTGDRP